MSQNKRHHGIDEAGRIGADRALILISGVVMAVAFLLPHSTFASADALKVVITPYTEYQERDGSTRRVVITTQEDGSYQLVKRVHIGLPELPIAHSSQRDIIKITGRATPGSTVSMIVQPMRLALTNTVDETGIWSVELPIDTIDAGIQNVLVVVNDHGIAYSAPIAQFRIVAVQQLSNTTWGMIAVAGSIVILLLFAANVRFFMRRKNKYCAL